ncbi:MAG TPA: hemolysin family protein [Vicinamibacterales bacterium]|nr:hemolysin family protein [Vicinamibacterales bacterium]
MSFWVWTGLAVLILGNSLYVCAEFGAVGVRRSKVRRLAEDGNWFARRLLPFVESGPALDRYVGASQIGITVTSLALGALGQATVTPDIAPILANWLSLRPETAFSVATVSVLIVLTAVQLVIGELVPKAIALQYPTGTALATVLPMRWSLAVFRPFLLILNGSANAALRIVGISAESHRHLHSPEEIELLIAESRDGGLLEPEEQERLHRALRLRLRTAGDLMVPRDRLTMVPANATWDDLVRVVTASPFSRLPVYRDTPERIIGTLRVKDLVNRYVVDGPQPLDRLIGPLIPIASTLPADRVIGQLREHRVHQALVVDAAGAALGIVTIQDVLTELLGRNPAGAQA